MIESPFLTPWDHISHEILNTNLGPVVYTLIISLRCSAFGRLFSFIFGATGSLIGIVNTLLSSLYF